MQATSSCWWIASWKKLEQEWHSTSTRAQQHLAKIADCLQKTTYKSVDFLTLEHVFGCTNCTSLVHAATSMGSIGVLYQTAHSCKSEHFHGYCILMPALEHEPQSGPASDGDGVVLVVGARASMPQANE